MAICTQCGLIMHEEDAITHKCKEEDKPVKGQPIRFLKNES